MKDQAGNYIFEYRGNTYKIMRMGWREQREFIGVLRGALNADSELEPFTEDFNKAQDWLLSKIAVSDGTSLQYLKDEFLDIHLESFNIPPVQAVNAIFQTAAGILASNFIQSGSQQNNSTQEPVGSSKSQNSQSKLSKTLKQ